jgi:VWFA-related protein
VPLRSDVGRVAVDVVVTDSLGRPVTGLTRDDFSIEENKVPQTVRFFDVHAFAPVVGLVAPKIPALPPNTFLNLSKAPESGTPTVILYDALNTPLTEQSFGHKQILDLLRHRRAGAEIAIFVLTGKLSPSARFHRGHGFAGCGADFEGGEAPDHNLAPAQRRTCIDADDGQSPHQRRRP